MDLPSKVMVCEQSGREFLVNNCLSLREGTFYRFISDVMKSLDLLGVVICMTEGEGGVDQNCTALHPLEIALNSAFDTYRMMYYDGGISSVHVESHLTKDGEPIEEFDKSFTVKVLIRKCTEDNSTWDSIHVIECSRDKEDNKRWSYRACSSLILDIRIGEGFELGGTLVHQVHKLLKFLIISHSPKRQQPLETKRSRSSTWAS